MSKEAQPSDEQDDLDHQVLANGLVIYSGGGWIQAFLDAGRNPANGVVLHRERGKPQAVLGRQCPSCTPAETLTPFGVSD